MIVALIPAYNAQHTIAEVIFKAEEYVNTVLVYNDGSTDQTSYIANKCGAIVIGDKKNKGKGVALKRLFAFAKGMPFGDNAILITLDADMQHDPREIPKLVKPLLDDEADVTVAERKISQVPRIRYWANKILDHFGKVRESQSGFRAYKKQVLDDINITAEGFAVDSEILMQVKERGHRIKYVPVSVSYGKYSHTKHPISHFAEVFNWLFFREPMKNLGTLGFLVTLFGLFFLIEVVRTWNLTKQLAIGHYLFGIMLILLGMQTFYIGVLLHMVKKK